VKRYRVTFIKWAEFDEFVEAASEDEAEERAREQLDSRDDPDSIDGGINLVSTEEAEE